jgi:general secretion pathway protein C
MNRLFTLIFSTRWIVVINLVLAAIIGYHATQFFLWLNLNSPPSTVDRSKNRSRLAVQQSQLSTIPTLNISALLEANLFGQIKSQNATQFARTPPKTKLNLNLHGIYYSSNPKASFAMIATAKTKSELYREAEVLPGGAILHQINPKNLILLRNGRHETLMLVDMHKNNSVQLSRNYASNVPYKKYGNNSLSPEKLLGTYQRQLKTNPNKLMKLIKISPVNQSGHFVGYRIKPGKDATLLSQFDLQAGDILTTINGVKLDSPLRGLGVVQQLATANHINLEVLRNGQVVPLSFNIEN